MPFDHSENRAVRVERNVTPMIQKPGRLPTLFIPHGGGPCFFMEPAVGPKDLWNRMAAHLRGLEAQIGDRPKAVLVISAHWEAPRPTVNMNPTPPMLFDYYGFPEHTYRLSYPAPGSPALAQRISDLFGEAGIASDTDATRGFDHGVFVPFLLIYPKADIPIVQLSLRSDLDPAAHIALGRALAPLRDQGVLIVGSGMSYHNLRAMRSGEGGQELEAFDVWLTQAVEDTDIERRVRLLTDWESAPHARDCHPESEHLVPLFVAAGAAVDDLGRRTYADRLGTRALSGFQFG